LCSAQAALHTLLPSAPFAIEFLTSFSSARQFLYLCFLLSITTADFIFLSYLLFVIVIYFISLV
jgi:hypothetical protein